MNKNLFFFLLITVFCFGQDYSVQSIPEELKKNAYVVVRSSTSDFSINSIDNIEIAENNVWTIMSKEGDSYSRVIIPYDKSTKVSDIKVTVFGENGKEIKTYSKKDFSDYSHTPSFGLYVDDRVLVLNINPISYPYTIKSSYKVSSANTVFINNFVPVNGFNISVENAAARFINKSGIKLRSKISNTDFAKINANESTAELSYNLKNFPALKEEKYSPSIDYLLPKVEFALDRFNLEGKQGDLNTWDSFGKWYYENLLVPSTIITPELKTEVAALNLSGSTEEKVRKIYHYMQDKTRYVFVAMGIGGWMPMNADEVRKKGYGDCKALTNYMRAMLDIAGIPSYYAVIKSDSSPERFDSGFPKMGGNHVILMVPDGNKNIWLENTNQKIAFNHLGYNTTNRNVLAVSNSGIKLVETPNYAAGESKELIKSKIKLKEDNSIDVTTDFKYTGGQYDFHMPLIGLSGKEKNDALKEKYGNLKFKDLEVKNFKNERDFAEITYGVSFSAADYSKKIGEDFLFRAVPFFDFELNTNDTERKLPFEIAFAYQDDYEMEFEAPEGYIFSEIPNASENSSEFGIYKIDYKITDNKLIVHRIISLNRGVYPKEKYKSYLEFRKKTINSDNAKILMTKK